MNWQAISALVVLCVALVGMTGFIWRINNKAARNCESLTRIFRIIYPDDREDSLVTIKQCLGNRDRCGMARDRMEGALLLQVAEIKKMIMDGEKKREEAKDHHAEQYSSLRAEIASLGAKIEQRSGA